MSPFVLILTANILISIASLSGIVTFLHKKLKSNNTIGLFVSFAAGTLLSSAFLNILHEALEEGDVYSVLLLTLAGMILSFFLERFFVWHHHHHEDMHNIKPSAALVIIGDAIHNFIDGLAIAATFIVSPAIGWTTTLAIAAHEIPQEIADFAILKHSGLSTKNALKFNFLSALSAVVGGIVGFYFVHNFDGILPLALGFTAGIFIYIASADLIPSLHEEHREGVGKQALLFIIGVLLIFFLSQQFIHSHEDTVNQYEKIHMEEHKNEDIH